MMKFVGIVAPLLEVDVTMWSLWASLVFPTCRWWFFCHTPVQFFHHLWSSLNLFRSVSGFFLVLLWYEDYFYFIIETSSLISSNIFLFHFSIFFFRHPNIHICWMSFVMIDIIIFSTSMSMWLLSSIPFCVKFSYSALTFIYWFFSCV